MTALQLRTLTHTWPLPPWALLFLSTWLCSCIQKAILSLGLGPPSLAVPPEGFGSFLPSGHQVLGITTSTQLFKLKPSASVKLMWVILLIWNCQLHSSLYSYICRPAGPRELDWIKRGWFAKDDVRIWIGPYNKHSQCLLCVELMF